MSFGFAPGDIIAAVTLAARIYEKCFTKAQAADQKYLQFGEEIKHFGESLDRLNDVFKHVEQQREQQRQNRPWPPHDATQLSTTLRPLPELTGDFRRTLEACEKLLNDNSRFRRNPAGFVDNVRWWLGVEAEVDKLKERIRFHTAKILLITKPVELQLLSDLRRDIWEVRRIVIDLRGIIVNNLTSQSPQHETPSQFRLPLVPPELESRFITAMETREGDSVDVRDFPLREGFDALVFHFGQSTVNFVPRIYSEQTTPELTQYLNLIKSTWILEKITESSFFVQGSLWSKCVEDMGTHILSEYHRFNSGQLTSPGNEVISRLEDSAFAIWIEDNSTEVVPTLTDERAWEEKILEIVLPKAQANRKSLLVVFRKSDYELRLVHTTTDEQNDMFYEAESYEININFTRFIPLYAVPNSVSATSTKNVLFCGSQGQSEKSFSFETTDDIHKIQQGVTGYTVGADIAGVAWRTFRTSASGECRVQIWRPKLLPRLSGTPGQSPNQGVQRRSTTVSSFSLANSLATAARGGSVVHGTNGPAVMYHKPDKPLVVLYTLFHDKWTFLNFEVDQTTIIATGSCNCRDCRGPNDTCKQVVIQSKGKLIIKRHSVSSHEGLDMWDLAVLRKPLHPHANASDDLPVRHIILAFPSLEEKLEFQTTFNAVKTLLRQDEQDYARATKRG